MSTGFTYTVMLDRPRQCEVPDCTRIVDESWLCEKHFWQRTRRYGVPVSNAQLSLIDAWWTTAVPGPRICVVTGLTPHVVWRVLFRLEWPGESEAYRWGWVVRPQSLSVPTGAVENSRRTG